VGQTVEPGICGQPQWHRQRQLVIDDRRERTAGKPGDQHLFVGLGVGDYREPRHLRAGPGGGRDRDDRWSGLWDLGRDLVIAHLSAIGEQHAHRLGGIDRAAAADRDKAVEATLGETTGAGLDDRGGRVGDGVGEHRPRDAGAIEMGGCPLEMPRACEKWIGDDQRVGEPEALQHPGQLGERAAANRHQARCCYDGNHWMPPSTRFAHHKAQNPAGLLTRFEEFASGGLAEMLKVLGGAGIGREHFEHRAGSEWL